MKECIKQNKKYIGHPKKTKPKQITTGMIEAIFMMLHFIGWTFTKLAECI